MTRPNRLAMFGVATVLGCLAAIVAIAAAQTGARSADASSQPEATSIAFVPIDEGSSVETLDAVVEAELPGFASLHSDPAPPLPQAGASAECEFPCVELVAPPGP